MRPTKKLEIICVVGIFLFALALRIYAFTYLPRRAITDDAYEYNYIAQNIPNALKNEPLENRATFLYLGSKRGWLYPLFIAGIYNIFGANDLYVRLIQLIIDALSCCFIYVIGKDMCNKKVGATAALLSSLYPGFIYYSTMLYQETTTIFLLILYVYFLNRALLQKKMYLFLISGIVAVIITFYRSGFLFFSLLTIPMLFLVLRLFYKKDFLPISSHLSLAHYVCSLPMEPFPMHCAERSSSTNPLLPGLSMKPFIEMDGSPTPSPPHPQKN
jgi:asparagine N-glycosylation enzyme membrane subunit Stt3